MKNAVLFFDLLSYAGQHWIKATACADQENEGAVLFQKYEAAITILADLWTGDDHNRADALMHDFIAAGEENFVSGSEAGSATDPWDFPSN